MNNKQVVEAVIRAVRNSDFHVRGSNVEVDCPECGGIRKLAVHADNGLWGCFLCGASGKATPLILGDYSAPWRRVREEIRGRGVSGGPRDTRSGPQECISLPLWELSGYMGSDPAHKHNPKPLPGLYRKAYEYCLSRGMTPDQITRYKVGIRPLVPRVYFPYWENGQVTFWMGRSINGSEPKTIEPGTTKPLFGTHVRTHARGEPLFLTEGVFDHFAVPQSVATMGSALSHHQAKQIADIQPSWVGVLWDPDALTKSLRACKLLWNLGVRAVPIHLRGTQKDPADLGAETCRALVVDYLLGLPVPLRLSPVFADLPGRCVPS